MDQTIYYIACLLIALGIIFGIKQLNSPVTAVKGNLLCTVLVFIAVIVTMIYADILSLLDIWIAFAIGMVIGLVWAVRATMIMMPQLVSAWNGFGGAAAMIVSFMVLDKGAETDFILYSSLLALAIGSLTFSGSMVAAGKLAGRLPQKPAAISASVSLFLIIAMVIWVIIPAFGIAVTLPYIALGLVISLSFGIVLAMKVGGADMPITISLLCSLCGVAGGIAGLALTDLLLVAISGVVGAAGLILTRVMCKAMNRHLLDILSGKTSMKSSPAKKEEKKVVVDNKQPKEDLSTILKTAKRAIIVPGYGMALAQAQAQVKQLADLLESKGVAVDFAIHPVAGRMPGHMNVLLAEVNVGYDKLKEMDVINPLFEETDIAIVVGANDVVNSAANTAVDTPIYGLPILEVSKAKHVVICNFDDKPGYAGVNNPLYAKESGVTLMWGDAKESVTKLISLTNQESVSDKEANKEDNIFENAKRVIFVPGYGMALAQAQSQVKQLADLLESKGIEVDFAIHPVAGRMPGHMNVLLAEVDVGYDKLKEMDVINPLFEETDVAIVVGANDVVNSAANTAVDTPIYGLPILEVANAKHVIICNFDDKPGYAGVNNPLYTKESGVTLMWGDAKESITKLINNLS